jgi:hypothetical protein
LEGYKSVYDRWEIILDLMKEVERRARYVEWIFHLWANIDIYRMNRY